MFFQNNLTTTHKRRLSAILCSEFQNPNQTLLPFASQYIISGILLSVGLQSFFAESTDRIRI